MRWDDADDVVYALECLGFPEELTKPLRDFLAQPIADYPQLAEWQRNAELESRPRAEAPQ